MTEVISDIRDTVALIIDGPAFSEHGLTYQPNTAWQLRRESAHRKAEEIIVLFAPWEVPDAE